MLARSRTARTLWAHLVLLEGELMKGRVSRLLALAMRVLFEVFALAVGALVIVRRNLLGRVLTAPAVLLLLGISIVVVVALGWYFQGLIWAREQLGRSTGSAEAALDHLGKVRAAVMGR
jgi:hypothetical protein